MMTSTTMMMRRTVQPFRLLHATISQSPRFLTTETRSTKIEDYFERLQLPRSFSVEKQELKQSYRKLMATLHPDRHTMESQEKQDDFSEEASQVTRAYSILQNPHERAVHLLELMGRPLEEAASSEVVGMEFLMEIMELREEIAETTEEADLERLIDDNQARMDAVGVKLATAFENADTLDDALQLTAQLQYWNRIDETLQEKTEVH